MILADPAWPSTNPHSSWSPEQHYPTISLEAIKALPIPAADDSVLFLWAVCHQLEDALAVIEAWGFTYKGCFVWVKPSIKLGNWIRYRHELLLFATRGNPTLPAPAHRQDSVIEAACGRHSEKPVSAYQLIECMYPTASRVELFARTRRPGWTSWGNEVVA